MSTTTKEDLSKAVAHTLACTKSQAATQVNSFFEKLTSEILNRDSILFSGFGRLDRKSKKSRLGRNPQTDEPITLDARTVVTFSGTGNYRKQLNKSLAGPAKASVEVLCRNDLNRDREAEDASHAIMTALANAMLGGDRVEIRGFGSFSIRDYQSYTGRNPRNGERVKVGAKKLPFFRPSRILLRRANS